MTMENQINPEIFREEIMDCLIEHLSDSPEDTPSGRKKHATRVLSQAFKECNADYSYPTYISLIEVMKKLAIREMKNKKNSKIIADNFMKIAKKIKAAEYKK